MLWRGLGVYAVAAQAIMLAMTERYCMLRFEGGGLIFGWDERVGWIRER